MFSLMSFLIIISFFIPTSSSEELNETIFHSVKIDDTYYGNVSINSSDIDTDFLLIKIPPLMRINITINLTSNEPDDVVCIHSFFSEENHTFNIHGGNYDKIIINHDIQTEKNYYYNSDYFYKTDISFSNCNDEYYNCYVMIYGNGNYSVDFSYGDVEPYEIERQTRTELNYHLICLLLLIILSIFIIIFIIFFYLIKSRIMKDSLK